MRRISNQRIGRDLDSIAAAGDDMHSVSAALATGGSRLMTPAGLAHTLAELDRILVRLEQDPT